LTNIRKSKVNEEYLNNLDGRYYLYYVDDKLIAITGCIMNDEYSGLEIDWTCTHPSYRHKGIMQQLFHIMINEIDLDIYCSCWRISNNDKVNLHTLMELFNFKKVVHDRIHCKVPYNCHCKNSKDCIYYNGINCECYEDLYLRKII
jgi:GNAT superfamily N-acetyltransferase